MKIGLAADHRGYKLKEQIKVFLQEKGYEIEDYGTENFDRVDYPIYAQKLCKDIVEKEIDFGITVCGTGIGMSIACNKIKGIYCAKVNSIKEAKLSRQHNDANVIAIKGNMFVFKAKAIVKKFLKETPLEDEVYERRINQVKKMEAKK